MDPSYGYLFFVAVAIASVYTSTGVTGANFWVPVYVLWLGLDVRVGFWLALFTMLFGSLAGLAGHAARRTPRWRVAVRWIAVAAPAALAGGLAAPFLPTRGLLAAFGLFALALGAAKVGESFRDEPGHGGRLATPRWDAAACVAGGLLVGAISVGLGALLLPRALSHRELAARGGAAGTVLVAVFATSLVAAAARLRPELVAALAAERTTLFAVLVWVIPGVLTGGLIGPAIATRLDGRAMRRYAGLVLVVAGALMIARTLAGG